MAIATFGEWPMYTHLSPLLGLRGVTPITFHTPLTNQRAMPDSRFAWTTGGDKALSRWIDTGGSGVVRARLF